MSSSAKEDFFAKPADLDAYGAAAWSALSKIFAENGISYTGGCRAFYSPKEWSARKEEYGTDAALIVVHDGGDVARAFNPAYEDRETYEDVHTKLAAQGFIAEQCTGWYTAIYANKEKVMQPNTKSKKWTFDLMQTIVGAVQDAMNVHDGGFAAIHFDGPSSRPDVYANLEEELCYALEEGSAAVVARILGDYRIAELQHRRECARGFLVSFYLDTQRVERVLGEAGIGKPEELLRDHIEKQTANALSDAMARKELGGEMDIDPTTHKPEVRVERA